MTAIIIILSQYILKSQHLICIINKIYIVYEKLIVSLYNIPS